ncbi:MAG: Dabb family protein [Sphingomonadales bacterium]|nr:Dabb family protein [Sphingomonadales bacterium]
MITHAVFFWLKRPDSAEDRDRLIEGIRGLAAIEVVRSLQVGIPADTGARDVVDSSFGVSEIITFDTVADEAIYQTHPLHEAFIAEYGHLWSRVTVYDIADPEGSPVDPDHE